MKDRYMKIVLLVLILTFNFQFVSAQNNGVSGSLERMKYDVSILASDSLQGREAGTESERKAAAYISAKMVESGLLPKGEPDGSYLSSFRMSYPVAFKDVKLQVSDTEFSYPEEIGATDLTTSGNVTAQLINVGKGFNASQGKYNSKGINNVKGKIAILDIATRKRKTDISSVPDELLSNVKTLVTNGAVGIILHNSSNKAIEDCLFGSPFTEPVGVPVIYISRLAYNRLAKLENSSCLLSVELDRNVTNPINVIGFIDNKSDKTVIIGAHYDHIGITSAKNGNEKKYLINNGADDNASGTAVMLELARWAVNNESLRYNYIFAAFSAEEKGLFGSKAFSSRNWVNADNIAYMLNLDMVGRLGCQGDTFHVLGVSSSPAWENVLDELEHPEFALKRINGAPAFSDHSPFLKKEIPVIYFTSGIHPDYHTPNDDAGLINYEGMSQLQVYLRLFLRSAEALPEIPFHKINTLNQTRAYFQTFK